jgi:hypothetical protein
MAGGVFVGSRVGMASAKLALFSELEWTSLLKSSKIEDNRRRESKNAARCFPDTINHPPV